MNMDEIMEMQPEEEVQARKETVCRGCDKPKELGLVVCWDCFKYRRDVVPFKEYGGTLSQWLNEIGRD